MGGKVTANAHGLAQADMETLRLLCAGCTRQQIADTRGVKLRTIEVQINMLQGMFAPDKVRRWSDDDLATYARVHILPHYAESGNVVG